MLKIIFNFVMVKKKLYALDEKKDVNINNLWKEKNVFRYSKSLQFCDILGKITDINSNSLGTFPFFYYKTYSKI